MDLHSHCASSEIIGLLGGKFDSGTNTLWISRAFACRALGEDDADAVPSRGAQNGMEPNWSNDLTDAETNVELDPVSEMEVRTQAKQAGLEIVGWYHSHPAFPTTPSLKDCEN